MQPNDDVAIASGGPDLVRLRRLLGAGRAAEVVAALGGGAAEDRATGSEPLVLLAEAHLALDATGPAVEAAREAVRRARTDDAAEFAAAVLALALARRPDAASRAEARRTLDPIVPSAEGRHDPAASRVRHAHGVLQFLEGRLDEARVTLLDAVTVATVCGDDALRALAHDGLADVQSRLGDTPRALGHLEASLRIRTSLGNFTGAAASRAARGRLLLGDRKPDAALAEFEACIELSHQGVDPRGLAAALAGRGAVLTELARFDEADAALRAALRIAESGGHARLSAACTRDLATLADRRGTRAEAVALATSALSRSEAAGDAEGAGTALTMLGGLHSRAGEKAVACAVLERAVQTLRATPRADLLAGALLALAETGPDRPEAPVLLDEAERVARGWSLRRALAETRRVRGLLPGGTSAAGGVAARNFVAFGRDPREYHLVERLPRSVQGEAWKAFDAAVGRQVVVRFQPVADRTEEDRASFDAALRDFEAVLGLDHVGVVRVLDFERIGRELFVATELADGPDLRARLRRGPPEWAVAWGWIAGLAAALDAVHAAGVVHRDLKPENVLFSTVPGAAERPMISDLGFAHLADRGGHLTGGNAGTAAYAAPEQWRKAPCDHRADLFTFGVIAIEVLTGRNFLTDGARATAEHAALMQDAGRVAALTARIAWPEDAGTAVRTALRRLVEHDPAARPRSASAAVAECLRG